MIGNDEENCDSCEQLKADLDAMKDEKDANEKLLNGANATVSFKISFWMKCAFFNLLLIICNMK